MPWTPGPGAICRSGTRLTQKGPVGRDRQQTASWWRWQAAKHTVASGLELGWNHGVVEVCAAGHHNAWVALCRCSQSYVRPTGKRVVCARVCVCACVCSVCVCWGGGRGHRGRDTAAVLSEMNLWKVNSTWPVKNQLVCWHPAPFPMNTANICACL